MDKEKTISKQQRSKSRKFVCSTWALSGKKNLFSFLIGKMHASKVHDRSDDAICREFEKKITVRILGTLSETNIKPLWRDTPSKQSLTEDEFRV